MSNRRDVAIDIAAIEDIALRGVRRAVAFLSLGLQSTRNGPPSSVWLENEFKIQWFADPLPAQVATELVLEYENWIIGSALKELDLYFGRFLDEVWHLIRLVEFHGRQLPPEFEPDKKFLNDTNVGKKLDQVEQVLGTRGGIASDYFDSYSRARNALSHNAGIVRERDVDADGLLSIRWHAPTIVSKVGDEEHLIDQRTGVPDRTFEAGAKVVFRMSERKCTFAVGERVIFSRFDLSELCFSYQNAAHSISKGLLEFLRREGITDAGSPQAASSE